MDPRLARLRRVTDRPVALYRNRGWWGQQPLWARVRDRAAAAPDMPAVIDDAGALTYGRLWQQSVACAKALKEAGLEPHDIILVQLPNWHEFVELAIGAESAGVVFAFCPIQWGLRETARALDLIRPKIWFTTTQPRPNDDRSTLIGEALAKCGIGASAVVLVRSDHGPPQSRTLGDWRGDLSVRADLAGGDGSDPLEIAVTSGTTGDPKGVLHVHDTALAAVQSTIRRQRLGPTDVVHLAAPVGHTYGYFYGVRCALQAGGTLVLQDKWEARAMIDLVARHGVTVSLGPSAFILDLLSLAPSERAPLHRLRVFTVAGDALPAPVARRAVTELPFRISRAFGMSEFGHAVSTDLETPRERVIDSVGTPQPEVELRIADERRRPVPPGTEGRILVGGPFVFAGYVAPDSIDEDILGDDGLFDTGDLGLIDDEGCLHITGRVKNVIRRGAETVPASLLEDVIAAHPDVINAVVVGRPHPRLGEVPVACIQLRPGRSLSDRDLAALFEQAGVTKKFWPVEIHPFSSWPLGPTGKIDRRSILERVLASTDASPRAKT